MTQFIQNNKSLRHLQVSNVDANPISGMHVCVNSTLMCPIIIFPDSCWGCTKHQWVSYLCPVLFDSCSNTSLVGRGVFSYTLTSSSNCLGVILVLVPLFLASAAFMGCMFSVTFIAVTVLVYTQLIICVHTLHFYYSLCGIEILVATADGD